MRVLLLSLTVAGSLAAAAVTPAAWIDLFQPPYQDTNMPEIIMSIGCVGGEACYVPGESNGRGPSVALFNGQPGGTFTPVQEAPSGTTFMQYIGVGGNSEQPHGAIAGVSFGGLPHYFVNKSYLADSLTLPFVGTLSVSADRATGMTVLMVNEFAGGLSVSSNGGETWASKKMTGTKPTENCTWGRYQTAINDREFYVTFGSNPAKDDSEGPNVRRTSPVSVAIRDPVSGKWRNEFRARRVRKPTESGCPYSAAIMKTLDGGDTWQTVYSSLGQGFEMNFIDCLNRTHCVATGSSYEEGAHTIDKVFTTTDGQTFKETLSFVSTGGSSVYASAVSFVPGTDGHVFVGTTTDFADGMKIAVMYKSVDGGLTWSKGGNLNFIGVVSAISCAQDGVCFASAITALRDSTILRYDSRGPPPTPAPTFTGNYTQKVCNGTCTGGNCTTTMLPQHTCLKASNGFTSFTSYCDLVDRVLVQSIYIGTSSCDPSNPIQMQIAPLDSCLFDGQGYLELSCGPSP